MNGIISVIANPVGKWQLTNLTTGRTTPWQEGANYFDGITLYDNYQVAFACVPGYITPDPGYVYAWPGGDCSEVSRYYEPAPTTTRVMNRTACTYWPNLNAAYAHASTGDELWCLAGTQTEPDNLFTANRGISLTIRGGYAAGFSSQTDITTLAAQLVNDGGMIQWSNFEFSPECSETSDVRCKKEITPLTESLDKITMLQGVSYEWRADEFPDRHFPGGRHMGLIAQETEKVVPEIVKTDKESYKSIAYDKLTPLLVEAIKELKANNERMRSELEQLKAQMAQNQTKVE